MLKICHGSKITLYEKNKTKHIYTENRLVVGYPRGRELWGGRDGRRGQLYDDGCN